MRTPTLVAATAVVLLCVIGCSQNAEKAPSHADSGDIAIADLALHEESEEAAQPATAQNGRSAQELGLSSSAARATGDTLRRFIRTADLRFRTKDLVKSTYAIEDLVAGMDGFVAHTHLASRIDHRYTTPISADSVLETTRFTLTNRMVLRVPVAKLDTTLKALARFVDFLDHRTVNAEDVRLMLLSNRMTQNRVARHEKRLTEAIDAQGRKLKETVPAEDKLLDRQEQADEAKLANLGLEDRIAFSTISLDLYQRQDIRREVLADERNIDAYEPGFGARLGEALRDGWQLMLEFLVVLARGWSVLLALALVLVMVRRIRKRAKDVPKG